MNQTNVQTLTSLAPNNDETNDFYVKLESQEEEKEQASKI